VSIAGFQVERVALAPMGAWPSGCAGYHPHDDSALQRYLSMAEEGLEAKYLEAFFDGTSLLQVAQ
jgi:glutaconate CoA-transferase subunit A